MSICSEFKPSKERHPCLVFSPWPQKPQRPSRPTPTLNLFSLSDRMIHVFEPPAPSICIGGGQGWLVLSDHACDLSLFNPITKQHIRDLPKISNIPRLARIPTPAFLRGEIPNYEFMFQPLANPFPPHLLTPSAVSRALVVPDPGRGGSLSVVLILRAPSMHIAWAKPGDKSWSRVENSYGFLDVICHKDQIFTAMCSGAVFGWGPGRFIPIAPTLPDINFLAEILDERHAFEDHEKQFQLSFGAISMFLVSTPSGELLRVRAVRVGGANKWAMKVQRVMLDDGSGANLSEVKDLGEHAILLGGSTAVCVSTVDVPELKGNRIYFAQGPMDQLWSDIGIYNMEDGSVEPMLPSMMPPYPPPSWIMINHA